MERTLTRQSGAVSLFVVIFASLLLTIITVSFVQLMLNDQRQATVADISQSAYDSALAGIEDAKRLLLLEQACNSGSASGVNCLAIESALALAPGQDQTSCDTIADSGIAGGDARETVIQQGAGDGAAALDQAYTCVKIAKNTPDYLGEVELNQSSLVPLAGVGAFTSIEISWFNTQDLSALTATVGFPSSGPAGSPPNLPRPGTQWAGDYPALLRAQFMQAGDSFRLSDLDQSPGGGRNNVNTAFLYPATTGTNTLDFNSIARQSTVNNQPQLIRCQSSLAAGGYACTARIQLQDPVNGSAANRNAFLRLTSLYNKSHYRIKLLDSTGAEVKFANVQPEVDSTGRANDAFRRVVSRVELRSDFTQPVAGVRINGDLCKSFSVTDSPADYTTTCTP